MRVEETTQWRREERLRRQEGKDSAIDDRAAEVYGTVQLGYVKHCVSYESLQLLVLLLACDSTIDRVCKYITSLASEYRSFSVANIKQLR